MYVKIDKFKHAVDWLNIPHGVIEEAELILKRENDGWELVTVAIDATISSKKYYYWKKNLIVE